MPDLTPVIALVGVVLGAGGVAALLQARSVSRRTNAEASKVDAEAEVTQGTGWREMWNTQHQDNNELRERVAVLEVREADCLARLAKVEGTTNQAAVERLVLEMLEKRAASGV